MLMAMAVTAKCFKWKVSLNPWSSPLGSGVLSTWAFCRWGKRGTVLADGHGGGMDTSHPGSPPCISRGVPRVLHSLPPAHYLPDFELPIFPLKCFPLLCGLWIPPDWNDQGALSSNRHLWRSFHPFLSFLPPSTFLPGSFPCFPSSSPSSYKENKKSRGGKCIQPLVRMSHCAICLNNLPHFSFPEEWWSEPNRCWLFFFFPKKCCSF